MRQEQKVLWSSGRFSENRNSHCEDGQQVGAPSQLVIAPVWTCRAEGQNVLFFSVVSSVPFMPPLTGEKADPSVTPGALSAPDAKRVVL